MAKVSHMYHRSVDLIEKIGAMSNSVTQKYRFVVIRIVWAILIAPFSTFFTKTCTCTSVKFS